MAGLINNELEKDFETSGNHLIMALALKRLRNPRKICPDSWCPGQDSNQAPLEYKYRELPLCQSAQLYSVITQKIKV
jgi:hypothetical protein